jgi:hypothetical protein
VFHSQGKPVVSDRLVESPDYGIWILFQKFAQAVAVCEVHMQSRQLDHGAWSDAPATGEFTQV